MNKEQNLTRAYCVKECRKWLTVLNELRIENVQLKEQLSEAISHEVSLALVEKAEQFQQQFVEKDQIIDLLRHDINTMLEKLHERTITRTEENQYAIMQEDMTKLIREFHQIAVTFYQFLGNSDLNYT